MKSLLFALSFGRSGESRAGLGLRCSAGAYVARSAVIVVLATAGVLAADRSAAATPLALKTEFPRLASHDIGDKNYDRPEYQHGAALVNPRSAPETRANNRPSVDVTLPSNLGKFRRFRGRQDPATNNGEPLALNAAGLPHVVLPAGDGLILVREP